MINRIHRRRPCSRRSPCARVRRGGRDAAASMPAAETLTAVRSTTRCGAPSNTIPELAIVRLGTEVEAAHVGEARTAYTPELLHDVRPLEHRRAADELLARGPRRRTRATGSRRPACGSACRGATGPGACPGTRPARPATIRSNSFDPACSRDSSSRSRSHCCGTGQIDSAQQQLIIAKRNQQSSELRFRESAIQTVAAVKQAYWTLKALRANVTVQQRSLALAEQLAKQNGVRVRVGQAPPLDLVQVQAEVADRRGGLIRAKAAADDGEDELRRLIMDPSRRSFWNVRLDPVDEPRAARRLPDVDAVVAQALDERYDLAPRAERREHRGEQRRVPLEPEAAGRAHRDVVPRHGLGGSQLLRTGAFPGTSSTGGQQASATCSARCSAATTRRGASA